MKYVLFFHSKSGYEKAAQSYVTLYTLSNLLYFDKTLNNAHLISLPTTRLKTHLVGSVLQNQLLGYSPDCMGPVHVQLA